jgi:hypothetical protein
LFEALVKVEANALKDVGAVIRLRAQFPGNGIDQALVSLDELRPGMLFPTEARLNQVPVRRRHPATILNLGHPFTLKSKGIASTTFVPFKGG